MKEFAKFAAIGLWLLDALFLGYLWGGGKLGSKASDPILHPLAFTLEDGQLTIGRCTERIVEVPFVLRNLTYPFRGRVLDVGYLESEVIFQLVSLGYETWGIDIRPQLLKFPGIHAVQGDVRQYPFPDAYFDTVIVLSTVEHIGLVAYGNANYDSEGDLHALQAVNRVLKTDGSLLLTVPFGRQGKTPWYRVYDHHALLALLTNAGFKVETENYWSANGIQWVPGSWAQVEQVDSLTGEVARGVACIRAQPTGTIAK
jgi:SAM-dependent methyltransferase